MHDILKKIHEYPFDMICPCSLTPMWEIICAILKGAHTYADLTVATGVRSGCSIYCITNTLAAFEAADTPRLPRQRRLELSQGHALQPRPRGLRA